jgi:hypothetical protein
MAVPGAIAAPALSCREPFDFVHDCQTVATPRRKIEIGTVSLRVAGSSDGTLVLLLAGPRRWQDFSSTYYQTREYERRTNRALRAVEEELERHGVRILGVAAVASGKWLYAYVIETDGDAYSILTELPDG